MVKGKNKRYKGQAGEDEGDTKVNDSKKKSLLKSLTWRLIGTTLTMISLYMISGKFELSIGVGILDMIVKTVIYYYHERAWSKIK